ncbi:MAG: TULIP family P47-like protein [Polyangiales bacterium]
MTTADTNGWDTVFAIKFPDVNAAIKKAKSSPQAFELNDDTDPDTKLALAGVFGDWALTTGGQGQNVHMALPITRGQLKRTALDPTSGARTETTLDLAGAKATIELRLEMVQPVKATANADKKRELKVKSRAAQGESTVTVLQLQLPTGASGSALMIELAKATLQTHLNANLSAFNHTFASVDLSSRADVDGLQWLMPTFTSYAVATENKTLEESVFAVLSMTEGREKTSPTLPHVVSPNAIPAGARSGFLISSERLLKKVLLPGMPLLFVNAKEDDFTIGDNGTLITNKNALTVQPLQLEDGKTIHPDVKAYGFKLSFETDTLHVLFDTLHFEYTPGMDAYVRFSTHGTASLEEQRIALKMVDGSTAGSTVEASVGVQVASIVSGLALIIVGAIVGVCVPGEAEVVGEAGAELTENGTTFALNEVTANVVKDGESIGAEAANANPITGGAMDLAANQAGGGRAFAGWLGRNWRRIGLITAAVLTGGGVMAVFPILEAVQQGNLENIPGLDKLTASATKPVSWPNAAQYTLTSVQLNGSLQLGGNPGFTS